jgi:hypothetical protein
VLALAGCGSTVQNRGVAGEAGLSGSPSDAHAAVGDTAVADEFGSVAPQTSAGSSSARRDGRAGGPSAATGSAAGKAASGGAVRGVTSTEIRIGYGTQKDADQAAVGFGLQAVFGDQEGQARAVVDDINKHGGVLGRKLVLVVHDDKTANDNASADTTATRQCADWTQDRPVFAGINIVGSRNRPSAFACMANARTPLLISDLTSHTVADLTKFAPYLYAPGVAAMERYVPAWIDRLNARGYFTSWNTVTGGPGAAPVKLGVPYVDSDTGRLYFETVKKALARIGRKADESFAFSEGTDALAQIPSTMLRFKSNNVTHVLLPESAYLFTPVAERQAYRPRYALTTLDGLSSLTITTSPAEQLRGALGVGWFPTSDVDAAHDPGDVSPNETRCKNVMAAAGFGTTDRLTLTTQLIVCELFYVLADGLRRVGSVTASALQDGIASLGTGFQPVFTFFERYGPGRYDGAGAARDLGYDNGCACFVYLDGINRAFSE